MLLQFSKMHGLGNDFVVIDNVTQNFYVNPEQIKQWADGHRGIGLINCYWSSRHMTLISIFTIAFLTLMEARSHNAVMGRDALLNLLKRKVYQIKIT